MIGKALKGLMGAVIGLSAIGVTAPAHADNPLSLNCTMLSPGGGGNGGTMFNHVVGTEKWEWSTSGVATCGTNGQAGQFLATFTGAGTSTGLGLCGDTGEVQNLSLLMDITFYRIDTGTVKQVHENWGADTTTFPETTPFNVSQNGTTIGYGTLFTHIFDHCPPGGTQSTVFEWFQSL